MFPSTQNFFANRDPYRSRIYNPPTFNHQIINKLKSPYHDLATWQCRGITKISSIASCEITNNITPSPTEYNRDVFLQSGLPYNEYTQVTKLKDIAEYDPNLCDKLDHYQQRFEGVGFKPLHEYPKLNKPTFETNANLILSRQLQIYRYLNRLQTAPNTCMVFESRHFLQTNLITQMAQSSVSSQHNETSDDEDNDELDYQQRICDYEEGLPDDGCDGWSSGTEVQALQHWYTPLGLKTIHDKEKLKTLFYGYIGEVGEKIDDNRRLYYDIPKELIQTLILFTFGVIHTIDSMMRMNIQTLNIEPYTFKHYEAQFKENNMQILEVNDSKLPNCVVALKSNVFMILNSVHSMHNFVNTLTFLNIKYHDQIMIYAYITDANGISYGTRITPDNLISTIQQIFPNQTVSIDDASLLKEFQSARDPILEQYKTVLFKKDVKAEQCSLNSFHKEIKNVIDECNSKRGHHNNYYQSLELEDVLSIFEQGEVAKEYFIDSSNRSRFIELLQENGIETAVGYTFWYRLGGVAAIDDDAHVIEDDIASELDAELCFIQQQFEHANEREEDEQDQEKPEEMNDETNGYGTVENGLENEEYFNMEHPPWSEYEDEADDNNDPPPNNIVDDFNEIWFPDINDKTHINDNIIAYSGRGKKGKKASRQAKNGNNKNTSNNNNHHHNPNRNGNPNQNNNNNNENNNDNNNGNQKPSNKPTSTSTSSIPPKGNCPFCNLSNASFSLYLHHCTQEHPEIGFDRESGVDIAVSRWKIKNESYVDQSEPLYHYPDNRYNQSQQTASHRSQNHNPSRISTNYSPNSSRSSEPNQSFINISDEEKKQNPNDDYISAVTPSASQSSLLFSTETSPSSLSSISDSNYTDHATNEHSTSRQNKSKFELSYVPDQSLRVRRNISIPKEITNNEKSKVNIDYEWMDKTIAMQFNNKENQINDDIKVFNLKGEYVVVEAASQTEMNDDVNSDKRKDPLPWRMRRTLYSEQMIRDEFEVKDVPKPIRDTKIFRDQLDQKKKIQSFLKEPDKLNKLLSKTNWCRVYTFCGRPNNKLRNTLFITKPEYLKDIKDKNKNNFDDVQLFPILMFKGKEWEIHYCMVVTIDQDVNIAISMIYSETLNRVKVTGIHIDKQSIYKQHQWIFMDYMDQCKYLDKFYSRINTLKIGNPDDAQNMINNLKKEIYKLQNELNVFKNDNHVL